MTHNSSSEVVIRRLYQITNKYSDGFEAQVIELLNMGLERLNLDIGILSRIKGDTYTVIQCVTPDEVEMAPGDQFEYKNTYCEITCREKSVIAVEHFAINDHYATHPAYSAFGLESYIGVPIFIEGELYGTLNFSSVKPYPRKFHEFDLDVIQLMASWIEVEIIRRKQEAKLTALNAKLKKQALSDPLTGIANRRGMFKHLKKDINRLSRHSSSGYLMILDIDFFKNINDKHGHQVGDKILISIAKKLKQSIRDYDFIARFGGEEFLLWLPDTKEGQEQSVYQRIMTNIQSIDLLDSTITASIGACYFELMHHDNMAFAHKVDELIAKADQALYQAKRNGRNRIEYYHPDFL
ncbi:sensor domain-containing diguanylate cyclase [Psychrobium sp. 1_MG-2023]|uniref:GGDEF domain-containing protein n=1 Tax=Psychrobium sp. 1_MG-2023 TaxID=3062624 RepID=UPI000C34FE3D|nr:sensor domain-containing diguanylate cyclase [Psychrobium sp. 1_MG-2023]MDP2561500.1 sensor domain-containing diguanylate cyclase [Psychrobium sp. 1_MG-2023]PKF57766.1 diguanylate cyclase [Alteromonadales bacterium alter-6D02]